MQIFTRIHIVCFSAHALENILQLPNTQHCVLRGARGAAIIIIRQQDLLPLSFPKIASIMDEKPVSIATNIITYFI